MTTLRRGSTRCARRHTKASRAHDPLIPLTCVRQAGEAAFYNLAISTIGELEAAKDPTDIDAFTKAFMPAFKKFAVLPHRRRELEAVMQKIQDAGEIVTEKESAVKADKEIALCVVISDVLGKYLYLMSSLREANIIKISCDYLCFPQNFCAPLARYYSLKVGSRMRSRGPKHVLCIFAQHRSA